MPRATADDAKGRSVSRRGARTRRSRAFLRAKITRRLQQVTPPGTRAVERLVPRDAVEEKLFSTSTPLRGEDVLLAFDQYDLFVEMADRLSARRQSANSFFLTLNTGLLTALGFLMSGRLAGESQNLTIVALGVLVVAVLSLLANFLWYRTIVSYRGILRAKFDVIDRIELVLPLKPYSAEWISLSGAGRYKPLSDVEQIIPVAFMALAGLALLAAAILLTGF